MPVPDPKRSSAVGRERLFAAKRPLSGQDLIWYALKSNGNGLVLSSRERTTLRRREFIALAGGAMVAAPLAARAQQRTRSVRVGTVSVLLKSSPFMMAFEQRMAELGYREGKNFALEYLHVPNLEGLEQGFREIVGRKIDTLLIGGPELYLKSALAVTNTLPIVLIAVDYDPFAKGYVTSLARPSGNVTGVYLQQIDLTAKRLQLLKDAFPEMQALTVFWDPISGDQWEAARDAGSKLGLRLVGIKLREEPYDYDRALAEAPPDHRKNIFVLTSPFFFRDRARIADLALRNRAISMFVFREWVEVGGLWSYGPSLTGMYRQAAEYIDRIAKGAKPTDLPIQQPTKFEQVVNLKTAKLLGITIPPSVLARADEVIE